MRRTLGALVTIPLVMAGCAADGDQGSEVRLSTSTSSAPASTEAPRSTSTTVTPTSTTSPAPTIPEQTPDTREDYDAAVAFVAAWSNGEAAAMRAVAREDAVTVALGHDDPTNLTDCHPQRSGQYQCLVDVAGGTRLYLLIGEPGAPEGRVWWVAQYVPGT